MLFRWKLFFLNLYFYTSFLLLSSVRNTDVDACCRDLETVSVAPTDHEAVPPLHQLLWQAHYGDPLSLDQAPL